MKYGLTNIKEFQNLNYETASTFVKQNWMKLIIIVFALFIILKKDISLNFNLHAAGSNAQPIHENVNAHYQQVKYPTSTTTVIEKKPEAVQSSFLPEKKAVEAPIQKAAMIPLPYFEPEHVLKKETPKVAKTPVKKIKDNRANTFANLTFILSPDYAKRKNIDPEIVIQKQETVYRYVKKYVDVAVSEMKKYGVPASITLAQGLLESDAGESRLAQKNNNHFGIKCFSRKCKKGHCANFTDDTHKDFFRKYKNVWESYRAHSIFLQRNRYAHLQKLGTIDYKNWAHGLKKAGYATDPKYADKLIKIIEVLELHRYDS